MPKWTTQAAQRAQAVQTATLSSTSLPEDRRRRSCQWIPPARATRSMLLLWARARSRSAAIHRRLARKCQWVRPRQRQPSSARSAPRSPGRLARRQQSYRGAAAVRQCRSPRSGARVASPLTLPLTALRAWEGRPRTWAGPAGWRRQRQSGADRRRPLCREGKRRGPSCPRISLAAVLRSRARSRRCACTSSKTSVGRLHCKRCCRTWCVRRAVSSARASAKRCSASWPTRSRCCLLSTRCSTWKRRLASVDCNQGVRDCNQDD
mmetsp:Transcript_88002/g.264783  ORF Transcript_88002/g.264783 Transcript_88002/m.264783 type:complete len:264 (+) Transcript_88002:573-1364(+)